MASEHLPAQLAVRVLSVSESGYYERRGRAPSRRAIRHAWLTGLIRPGKAGPSTAQPQRAWPSAREPDQVPSR